MKKIFICIALVAAIITDAFAQVPTVGLDLWLKADALSLADGDSVSLWQDYSGKGRDATSSGTSRPIFKTHQQNSLPAVRFSGTTGFASSASFMNVPLATGSTVTCFVVVANKRASLVQQAVDVIIASKTSGDINLNTGFGFSTYNGFATTSTRRLTSEAAGGSFGSVVRKNGISNSINLSLNETVIATYIGWNITNKGIGSGTSTRLGTFVNEVNGLYGQNDICEVILYRRVLSSEEVLRVENYLSAKYAITTTPQLVAFPTSKNLRGGQLTSKETFLYGRYEVRAKSAVGSGLVSSFFTYHEFTTTNADWNEIDIEWLGRYNNEVSFNVITSFETSHVQRWTLNYNPHNEFHNYAFEWAPSYVAWFIDGNEVYRQTQQHISELRKRQKIMMNLWQPIYTDWSGVFSSSILPRYAFYDWVKYSSYTPDSGNTGTNNNFTFQWQDQFDSLDVDRWERNPGTWNANNALLIPDNVVFKDGQMILCMTTPASTGFLNADSAPIQQPSSFSLSQNYPNPFNPSTTIRFELSKASDVRLEVFDLLGRSVAILVNERKSVGSYQVQFSSDRMNLASGVYFYRLQAGEFIDIRKMTLLK